MALFLYELSRSAPTASSLQTDAQGRDFLIDIGNGTKGRSIRNDVRIMTALKEISPVMHNVSKTNMLLN